jgi:2-polyprenyl-3-methyl-5-hydroxy-6-metoxy-1,4-benzoquinol methylase
MHKNKDFYNWDSAESYYLLASEANEAFSKTIEFTILQKYIASGASVIEFWCGDGSKIWVFPRDRDLKLFGIDISKTGIGLAKKKYPWVDFSVFDFGTMDAKYDRSFDIAMSFFVIEHVDDPEELIRAMKNSITKNWKIILWFPNYGSPFFPSPPTLYKKNFL